MLSSSKTTRFTRTIRDPGGFVASSLAARPQSVAEIEGKLAARGVDADAAASAVEEAIRLGFLDDEELAGQLARGLRTRGYGRRRASSTLRRRGLGERVSQLALDQVFGETLGGEDEVALARRALRSRPLGDDRARRRAVGFLVRRGFSAGAAWGALRPPAPAEPPEPPEPAERAERAEPP